MEHKFILAAVFACVLTTGCQGTHDANASATPPAQLTHQRQEAARRDIAARIDEIIRGAGQLDVEAASRPYSSDPSFRVVNPDGSIVDYPTMKRSQEEAFESMASQMLHDRS